MSVMKNLTKWQNYAHYALLALGLNLVAKYQGAPFDFNMWLITFGSLFVLDTVVHFVFASLPAPYKWSD